MEMEKIKRTNGSPVKTGGGKKFLKVFFKTVIITIIGLTLVLVGYFASSLIHHYATLWFRG